MLVGLWRGAPLGRNVYIPVRENLAFSEIWIYSSKIFNLKQIFTSEKVLCETWISVVLIGLLCRETNTSLEIDWKSWLFPWVGAALYCKEYIFIILTAISFLISDNVY